MSAVEEIDAAIARLTEWRNEIGEGVAYQSFGGVSFSPANIVTPTTLIHGENAWDGALEIFVVLHRTIDAQLAILKAALGHMPVYKLRPDEEVAYVDKRPSLRLGLDLARAINGTPS